MLCLRTTLQAFVFSLNTQVPVFGWFRSKWKEGSLRSRWSVPMCRWSRSPHGYSPKTLQLWRLHLWGDPKAVPAGHGVRVASGDGLAVGGRVMSSPVGGSSPPASAHPHQEELGGQGGLWP